MALGTQTVFELANLMMAEPLHAVDTYVLDGSASRLDGPDAAGPSVSRAARPTPLVVGTLQPLAAPAAPELLRLLDRFAARARAGRARALFVLADAGLARRTPRHHALVLGRRLAATPPPGAGRGRPHLHRRRAGLTSAGMTAEIDLALALVEKDLGTKVARAVAHRLVMHQRRSGGQSQHSEMLRLAPVRPHPAGAGTCAAQPGAAAQRRGTGPGAKLSPRQFSRVFTAETGQSPAKAVERCSKPPA